MKGGHQLAALKQLYARERDLPLRTAQHHAKHGHPEWQAFLARNAGQALMVKQPSKEQAVALVTHLKAAEESGVVKEHVAPPAMSKPEHLRTPEEYVECQAWAGLVLAHEQRDLAMAKGDAMNALGFVNLAAAQVKSYHAARAARIRAEQDAGSLKPMSAWGAAKTAFVKIAGLIHGLQGIAGAANPEAPQVALIAINDWKQRTFGPAVESLIEDLNRELAA